MQSQGAVISHVKQRGNHGVTVQPVVSGAKIHAQYFQWEYNGVLSICGAAWGGEGWGRVGAAMKAVHSAAAR